MAALQQLLAIDPPHAWCDKAGSLGDNEYGGAYGRLTAYRVQD
jgi:hypothetical protein